MENEELEVVVPQEEEQQEIAEEDLEELKRRADVSSQNFERAKKAEAEKKALQEKIAQLEAGYVQTDYQVDPQIAQLTERLNRIEEEKQLDSIRTQFPILSDKKDEFEEYRKEFPGVAVDKVAKLFASENVQDAPQRKGLEKGGTRKTPPASGKMSADDVKRLRTENYKEYSRRILAGTLEVES